MPATVYISDTGYSLAYEIRGKHADEVQAQVDNVVRLYHPAGYGTYFGEVAEDPKTGEWVAYGSRARSCD